MDLLFLMVKRKKYFLNPISRQNFANAFAETPNLNLEVRLNDQKKIIQLLKYAIPHPHPHPDGNILETERATGDLLGGAIASKKGPPARSEGPRLLVLTYETLKQAGT